MARSRWASSALIVLFDVVDLGREIVPPESDTEQEPHTGHDPVAIADAGAALDQMQLERAHIVGRGGIGRALQISRKPLAAVNMAALRMRVELARNHILDHALTQRADGAIVGHGEFHSLS